MRLERARGVSIQVSDARFATKSRIPQLRHRPSSAAEGSTAAVPARAGITNGDGPREGALRRLRALDDVR
jgi:hypothetical protein